MVYGVRVSSSQARNLAYCANKRTLATNKGRFANRPYVHSVFGLAYNTGTLGEKRRTTLCQQAGMLVLPCANKQGCLF